MRLAAGAFALLASAMLVLSPAYSEEAVMSDDTAALALREFLLTYVPKDSALMASDQFAREERTRLDHLEHARDLVWFPPCRLVKILHMDPAAGAPGSVLADVRVVYDPTDVSFRMGSVAWVNEYRAAHPLDVEALTDAELGAYIKELVSLAPMADRWGFKVTSVERTGALAYRFAYTEPDDMNMIGDLMGGLHENVTFRPDGGIGSFPYMEEVRPMEGWGGLTLPE